MDILPRDIHVGMKVFDAHHHELGKVKDFKFSENELDPDTSPAGLDGTDKRHAHSSIITDIAEAFGADELPDAIRSRLESEGYIRIDGGLLAADHFALPSQIASAAGDEVTLSVDKDALIKRPN